MKKLGHGLEHIECVSDEDDLPEIRSDGFFIQPFFTRELSGKVWDRYVSNIKMMIRSSYEYKSFIGFVKTEQDLRNCSFLSMVNDSDADVEIHHCPLTIHDIIEIVTDHMLSEGAVTTLTVCHEVMQAHFDGLVGVVPLSKTIHQLVHAGKINVHLGMVYGDVMGFLERYEMGVKEDHLKKIKLMAELSKSDLHQQDLLAVSDDVTRLQKNGRLTMDDVNLALLECTAEEAIRIGKATIKKMKESE